MKLISKRRKARGRRKVKIQPLWPRRSVATSLICGHRCSAGRRVYKGLATTFWTVAPETAKRKRYAHLDAVFEAKPQETTEKSTRRPLTRVLRSHTLRAC